MVFRRLVDKVNFSDEFVLFISKNRMRYIRGVSWAGAIQALLIALTFAKVWQDTFEYYHIPPQILYFIVPAGYFGVCWFIGFIDEQKGFWRIEVDYHNKNLNPMWDMWCNMDRNTREANENLYMLHAELKDLRDKLERLNEVPNDKHREV